MDKMIEVYDNPKPKKPKNKQRRWFFLGLLAILIKSYTLGYPETVEKWYSNGFFPWVRWLQDGLFGWLWFPALYLVVPFMLWKIRGVFLESRRKQAGCLPLWFIPAALASALWLVFWFTALWGLNYNRIPLTERADLYALAYDSTELITAMNDRLPQMQRQRGAFAQKETAVPPQMGKKEMEEHLRKRVRETMEQLGYQPQGHPRLREIGWNGLLLRWGTAGFYFPFTGECHIDAALHPLQKPFTIAHELAHGFGEGDEAACNFIAYWACRNSESPYVRYSAELIFWRYLASNYKRKHAEHYRQYRAELPGDILLDLNGINANNAKYPDILPEFRDITYDTYLKAQGVSAGNASYSQVVEMVMAFEQQQPEHPLIKNGGSFGF